MAGIMAGSSAGAGQSLPVLVWIHGGGNVWGGSSLYDGSQLAVNEDVIVVAVQYRVGPLGWFAHPASSPTSEPTPASTTERQAIIDENERLDVHQTNQTPNPNRPELNTEHNLDAQASRPRQTTSDEACITVR